LPFATKCAWSSRTSGAHVAAGGGGHGRGDARGVAQVLEIGLHADKRQRVAVGADAQSRDDQAVDALREERAVGNVRAVAFPGGRVAEGEVRIDRVSVGVEVRIGCDDRVRKGAPVQLVENCQRRLAGDAAALARVDQTSQVEGVSGQDLRVNEDVPDIEGIGLIDDGEVGVGVTGAELARRQARALDGQLEGVRRDAGDAGRGGQVGVAGGVDERFAQDDAAAGGRGDHDAEDAVAMGENAAAHGAEPNVRAGRGQRRAPPFGFLLDLPGSAARHFGAEAHAVSPVVLGDGAVSSHAAQAVQELHNEGAGAAARRGDTRRRPAGSSAGDDDVELAEDGERARLLHDDVDEIALGGGAQPRQDFTDIAARRLGALGAAKARRLGGGDGARFLGRRPAHPLPEGHQRARAQESGRRGPRNIGAAAQNEHARDAGGLEGREVEGAAAPAVLRLAVHGVGRHLEEHVGGEPLAGIVCQASRGRLRRRQGGVVAAGKGQGQGVVEDAVGDALLGVRRADLADRKAGTLAGLSADDDASQGMGSRGKRPEARAGHAGDPGAVGGVDNDLGLDRLAAAAIGDGDAAELAAGAAQDVGDVARVQEVHLGRHEGRIENLLDLQRPGGGDGRRRVDRPRPDDENLANEHARGVGRGVDREGEVARARLHLDGDRHGRDVDRILVESLVDGAPGLGPGAPIRARVGPNAAEAVVGAVIGQDTHELDVLLGGQLEEQAHAPVVLDALARRRMPGAVPEERRRRGVLVNPRRGAIRLVSEGNEAVGLQRERIGGAAREDPLGERSVGLLAGFEPEPERRGHVLAEVGVRRDEEHPRAGLAGGNGGGHRARAAAGDDDIRLGGAGKGAFGFVDEGGVARLRGGEKQRRGGQKRVWGRAHGILLRHRP